MVTMATTSLMVAKESIISSVDMVLTSSHQDLPTIFSTAEMMPIPFMLVTVMTKFSAMETMTPSMAAEASTPFRAEPEMMPFMPALVTM